VSVPVTLGRGPLRSGAAQTAGPLIDTFGRVHTDLRLSVTDRCNLRCTYCMPEEGVEWLPRADLLTVAELERVARVAHGLGVRSVRITGGEPLLRPGLVDIVARVAAIGFDDIAMTTNAMTLASLARRLAHAGLRRVNISCDSLDPARFAAIRRRGDLATVLAAMDRAEAAGLTPVKINVVVTGGVNDDEVVDFARFARQSGRVVRFIEYMPLDAQHAWDRHQVVAGADIVARIGEVWPLAAVAGRGDDPAPADRYRFVDGAGEIGVIASVTTPSAGPATGCASPPMALSATACSQPTNAAPAMSCAPATPTATWPTCSGRRCGPSCPATASTIPASCSRHDQCPGSADDRHHHLL